VKSIIASRPPDAGAHERPPERSGADQRIADLEADVQRLTEAAHRESRAKDEFLATLSHELRTPLNAVLGWLQLLRVNIDNPRERGRAIDVLERNVRAQAQLVADLLDLSRIITGRMRVAHRRVWLDKVIRRGVKPVMSAAKAKNVELSLDIQPIQAAVYGDSARLQQVVWNLVSNAVRFTSTGGKSSSGSARGSTDATSRSRSRIPVVESVRRCCRSSSIVSVRATAA
jgi:signal transduction histidine kinase